MTAFPTLTREQYDALDRLNWSRLRMMRKSPAHFRAWRGSDSAAKQRGRAVHLAVLEPNRLSDAVCVFPGKVRRGKAWEEFEAANVGREILTQAEFDQMRAMADAVHSHPVASKYVTGLVHTEQTVLWESEGVKCKGRIDAFQRAELVDLKTTRDASPLGFGVECAKYGTHLACAWYADGVAKAEEYVRRICILIAVEPEPPFAVGVYRVPESLLDDGRREVKRLLALYRQCVERNEWPSYGAEVMDLTLPTWALNEEAA